VEVVMDTKNESSDKTIYNICTLIHNLVRLEVEFVDANHTSSFKLFNSQIPFAIQHFRSQTVAYMNSTLRTKAPFEFLNHIDNLQLSYLAIGYWRNEDYRGSIIIGPFLTDIPDDSFISKVIEGNKLPLGHRFQLQQYYRTLPILDADTSKNIGSLAVNLAINPLIHANEIFSKNHDFILNEKDTGEIDNEKFYSEVELRYKLEKEIQNAVEKGLKEELVKLLNSFSFNPIKRAPNNPLRARKNLAFAFNTLLRTAAERGGVSPIYLHNTSNKFATLIEKMSNTVELGDLTFKMALEYCDLVKRLSTAGYSPSIRKAIDYINLNFSDELSLNTIAEKVELSPSHLSRQFKKETNSTVIEFINKRRVEEAKFLIKQNNNSITEIALMVGFENPNYFCTVFKQITSLTPKEYLMNSRNAKNGCIY
jgi:two-component system response regulator YesN